MRRLFQASLLVTTALCAPVMARAAEAAASGSATADVSEIIVTAQKREQRLQDVPLPITAVGGEQMAAQGIRNTGDLTRIVPGLLFVKNTAYAQPSIRGIGSKATGPGESSSVALYLDGVYLPGPQSGMFSFGYVERVEVLKGPQGTLFGRNATGGAINVITRTPRRTFFAEGEAGYGSYGLVTGKAYVTGPITDTLRADVQAYYENDDGYIKNVANGHTLDSADNYGFRVKAVWDATEHLSLTGTVDWVWDANHTAYSTQAINGNVNQKRLTPSVFIATAPYEISSTFDPFAKTKQEGAAIVAEYDAGFASLKSITSARRMWNSDWIDSDITDLPNQATLVRARDQANSQEFIATSKGDGRVSWLGGLFLFWNKNERNPQSAYAGSRESSRLNAAVTTEAYAPYGEVTVKVTDRLTAIGGLRYSHEKKHLISASFGALRRDNTDSWSNVDYRATLQYFVSPELNVYLTNSTGFKSGGYNASNFTNPPIQPETVKAWEFGGKYSSHGIIFNADAFYYDWKDIQIQRTTDPTTGASFLQNAASAVVKGVEIEARAPLGDFVSVNLGATFMKGTYEKFPGAEVLVPIVGGGNRTVTIDASGNPTYRTPERTLNAGIDFKHDLMGGTFAASASVYYTSEFSWEPGNRVREPSYTLTNARVSWTPDNGRYTVSLWGENLGDAYYHVNSNIATSSDSGTLGVPRRFGVTLSMRTE